MKIKMIFQEMRDGHVALEDATPQDVIDWSPEYHASLTEQQKHEMDDSYIRSFCVLDIEVDDALIQDGFARCRRLAAARRHADG